MKLSLRAKHAAPAGGCTVRIVRPGNRKVWATLELTAEMTAAIDERAVSDGVDFAAAFTGLLRAFFAREGKEAL